MKLRIALWILWPSFLAAGIAEMVLFSIIDPLDLTIFGKTLHTSREAVYSIGFLLLWAVCALSSALTLYILPGEQRDWTERTSDGGLT